MELIMNTFSLILSIQRRLTRSASSRAAICVCVLCLFATAGLAFRVQSIEKENGKTGFSTATIISVNDPESPKLDVTITFDGTDILVYKGLVGPCGRTERVSPTVMRSQSTGLSYDELHQLGEGQHRVSFKQMVTRNTDTASPLLR